MLKFIDLFSGLGGFRIAFEDENCKCVFSSEIDKYVCDVYEENFGERPQGDISKIESSDIPDFNILCAGFPCQPFSLGGLRKGFEDTRGTLFFEVARILKDKKPEAFILENVKGLVSHDNGNTLKVILSTLDDLGYNYSYKVINAMDCGVPQNRERWYCVGFRNDLNIRFIDDNGKDLIFPEKKELDRYIEDIIEEDVVGHEVTDIAKKNIMLHIEKIKIKDCYDANKFIIANEIRPSRCSFRNNGTVPCFTAKMGTGGNNVPVIVEYNRKITVRECLRVMGFPDKFKIKENYGQSYKQIGNSVVVTIIEYIANNIKKALEIN